VLFPTPHDTFLVLALLIAAGKCHEVLILQAFVRPVTPAPLPWNVHRGYTKPMKLTEIIPDGDVLVALEPDELGLRMLPILAAWPQQGNPLQLSQFLFSVIGEGTARSPGQYAGHHRGAEIRLALIEAWAWLQGQALLVQDLRWRDGAFTLSRRARKLAKERDPRRVFKARVLPKDVLHQRIREDVWSLYHRGKYDTAVFEAMKAVEVAVRSAANLDAGLLGVKLMREAFKPQGGPLTDVNAEAGEQVARMELFAGAIGSYKNPHSHRNVALDDPDEAAEIIMLLDTTDRVEDRAAPLPARHCSARTRPEDSLAAQLG
jgi:uncharacterized protein (TIGR02391 family)